jgi:malonyl-CoA/methylmalonyl-CoA synthetase
MEARIGIDEESDEDAAPSSGELEVRGKNLFKEYWHKPSETKKSFTYDDWFKTGDMVEVVDGNYKIIGRLSTDIIKSGGYKISSLEIEAVLMQHSAIKECAVLGVEDETYGEKIAAVLVMEEGQTITLEALREFTKDKLAAYKLPAVLQIVEQLPRNVMGKVVKSEVKKML